MDIYDLCFCLLLPLAIRDLCNISTKLFYGYWVQNVLALSCRFFHNSILLPLPHCKKKGVFFFCEHTQTFYSNNISFYINIYRRADDFT